MKNLTLTQLRRAIHVVKTSKRFQNMAGVQFHIQELEQAEAFLTSQTEETPRDPREVLVEIGYKL